jgi:hypothetical protein
MYALAGFITAKDVRAVLLLLLDLQVQLHTQSLRTFEASL